MYKPEGNKHILQCKWKGVAHALKAKRKAQRRASGVSTAKFILRSSLQNAETHGARLNVLGAHCCTGYFDEAEMLGPPVEGLEEGYPFSVVYFSRGTLPQKT